MKIKSVDMIYQMSLNKDNDNQQKNTNPNTDDNSFSSMLKKEQEKLKLIQLRKQIKETDIQDIAQMMKRR